MSMSSALAPGRSKLVADWPDEPPVDRQGASATTGRHSSPRAHAAGVAAVAGALVGRQARRKGASQRFARIPIAFGIGIAMTLTWQSYGDAVREIIAERYPPLAWLAPRVPIARPAPAGDRAASPDAQDLKTISLGLTAVRQRVDQLAAGQDQINREITTKLQAAKQEILDKMSSPSPQPATPARKPVPTASQPSPAR
jgi:hypothetical protein